MEISLNDQSSRVDSCSSEVLGHWTSDQGFTVRGNLEHGAGLMNNATRTKHPPTGGNYETDDIGVPTVKSNFQFLGISVF